MNAQEQVAKNTADRGYRDGWTAEQFAARQVAKLTEELGELARYIAFGGLGSHSLAQRMTLHVDIIGTGDQARWNFDDQDGWSICELGDMNIAKSELADIQVVVFNLAHALAEITGEPFDVVQAAVEKSAADVERGVR